MYKIYGIMLGWREVETPGMLPDVPGLGPTVRTTYFMWCLKGPDTTILVDTGLKEEHARARKLSDFRDTETQLRKIGIDPAAVTTMIVSHLHWDHFSIPELYPRATFLLQQKEMEFFTGPASRSAQVRKPACDIPEAVRLVYQGRFRFLNGEEQVAPGLRVALTPGHTPGSQVVAVTTARGEVVLCTDTLQLYEQMERGIIGYSSLSIHENFLSLDKIRALASSPDLIVPGHDVKVLDRFPLVSEGIVEIR